MRLHRFFVGEMGGDKLKSGGKIVITNESLLHQWKKVFRLASGDKAVLFDGSGNDFECKIETLSKDRAELAVGAPSPTLAISKDVWLFVALIKKDHFEWVVEKGTELGVNHFVPVVAERSEKKDLNMERLTKIVKEASEQSGRGTVPEIHAVMSLEDAVVGKISETPSQKIAFDPEGVAMVPEDFAPFKFAPPKSADLSEPSISVALFIGPEGGWSENELALFAKKNVSLKNIGKQILRAETAAIASATLFLLSN